MAFIMSPIYLEDEYARYDDSSFLKFSTIAIAVAEKEIGVSVSSLTRKCFTAGTTMLAAAELEAQRQRLIEAAKIVNDEDYVLIQGRATSLDAALKAAGISPRSVGLQVEKFSHTRICALGEEDDIDSTLILKKLKWMKK